MKTDSLFIGNIRKCTKYTTHTTFKSEMFIGDQCIGSDSFGYVEKEDELYKENAILFKTKNGGYVDLDNLNNLLDLLKMHVLSHKEWIRIGGLIMVTSPSYVDNIFVDTKTLVPYSQNNNDIQNNISLKKAKNKN